MERPIYRPLPMTRMAAGVTVQAPGAYAPMPVRPDSPAIEAMTDFRQVAAATIGVTATIAQATLKEAGRQHALGVDRDQLTREEIVRGVFSATQIGRQLGVPNLSFEVARTFAEIEAELAR